MGDAAGPRLALIQHPKFLEHRAPGGTVHAERPERLLAVHERLANAETDDAWIVESPAAALDVIERVHPPAHVAALQTAIQRGGGYLDPDTYAVPASWGAALHAAGAVIRGIDLVRSGGAQRAFALTRPPGHHATAGRAMGFCLLNSVAVGAAYARSTGAERIAIVDWDVHHGNGTQDIFYNDPRVLYVSLHQSPLYPGTGALEETGAGKARGTTLNVPLPPATGDVSYRRAFETLVGPALERFAPDWILVSAGYDAHAADPLANMLLSTGAFAMMADSLCRLADALCDGRLVACLEGGYDLQALADSVAATVEVMSGERPVEPVSADPAGLDPTCRDILAAAQRLHGLAQPC